MEIYVAISDFTPPIVDGSQNILEFSKGDTFEIFDCHKTGADWWGARALKNNLIGYVPSRYMQYEERRIGKLLPTDYKFQLLPRSPSPVIRSQLVLSRHMTTINVGHQARSSKVTRNIQHMIHDHRSHSVPSPGRCVRYQMLQDQKETSLKRLSDMQNSPDHRKPEKVVPNTPVPDYGDAATPENQSVFKFTEKFRNVMTSIKNIDSMYDDDEPAPDYNDESFTLTMDTERLPVPQKSERSGSTSSQEGGQVIPKKIPNPCIESSSRQALHKELLLNYKRGVNVLEKPELNKVLSQRRDTQKRKEWEEQKHSQRTSLEMKLELRATKLHGDDMKTISEKDEANKPELEKAFAKFAQKSNGHVK